MNQNNPLQKYFRQPKIYIKLPSKGLYYDTGVLVGDYNNAPVFAMTGMDEIIYKTPDALYSGEATIKVIESCCPYIKDAKHVPSLDIESLIIAIRIATFGENISIDQNCPHCGAENTYEVPLTTLLDYYQTLNFENTLVINDELIIKIRPLKYFEMNHYAVENFKLQKTVSQMDDVSVDDQQKYLNDLYSDLADLQLDLFLTSIECVKIGSETVTDKQLIGQWLENSDRELFQQIKTLFERNRNIWSIPPQKVKCSSCNSDNELTMVLDQSNFFV
jgi:hypothetical protein